MVPEVHDIVVRQESQRRRWIGSDQALHISVAFRNVLDHMRNVVIVGMPERREVIPRAVFVVLAPDPVLLRIPREYERRPFLRADEALMVVRGGVDEMPDHLLRRPFARRRRLFGLRP